VARLVADEVPGLAQRTPFTLNGFYPAMREQFVEEGAKVRVWALKESRTRASGYSTMAAASAGGV
jgi:hypothetical protein